MCDVCIKFFFVNVFLLKAFSQEKKREKKIFCWKTQAQLIYLVHYCRLKMKSGQICFRTLIRNWTFIRKINKWKKLLIFSSVENIFPKKLIRIKMMTTRVIMISAGFKWNQMTSAEKFRGGRMEKSCRRFFSQKRYNGKT